MDTLRALSGEPPQSEEVWYWIGLAGFALGALLIVGLWLRSRGEDQDHFVLALASAVLAAISYFALGAGLLDFDVAGKHVAQVPHYVDWLLTTPLILLSLVVIGLPPVQHFARQRERTSLLAGLLALNVVMILSILFADLSATTSHHRVWYGIAALCFVAIAWLVLVFIRKRAEAHGGRNVGVYRAMAAFLMGGWALYGLAFALGPQGEGDLWGESTDAAILTFLDLGTNLAFSLLALLWLERLRHRVSERVGHSTIELASGYDEVDHALEAERDGERLEREPQAGSLARLP